jgi:hypothetical protein
MVLVKRDISPVTASTRARTRGESPSGFNPSPAQPCAGLSVPAAREGAEPRHFSRRMKVPCKAPVAPVTGGRYGARGKPARDGRAYGHRRPASAGCAQDIHADADLQGARVRMVGAVDVLTVGSVLYYVAATGII